MSNEMSDKDLIERLKSLSGGEDCLIRLALVEIESLREQLASRDAEVAELKVVSDHNLATYHQAAELLRAGRDQLRNELETERMRNVACGVVATADTPDSAKQARDMHPDYMSASCSDVARRVDECIKLREQVTLLRDAVEEAHALAKNLLSDAEPQVVEEYTEAPKVFKMCEEALAATGTKP